MTALDARYLSWGPDMAPQTPQRSGRPGQAVTALVGATSRYTKPSTPSAAAPAKSQSGFTRVNSTRAAVVPVIT